MERLTKISEITGLPMSIELIESCGESACRDVCDDYVENSCIDCPIQKCMSKLKEYQDTGLEPEEIKQAYDMYLEVYSKVSEYADLMRQGLLINLPCKVGDGVYGIDGTSGIITKIHYELSKEWSFETNNFYSRVINWNWFANIGKTVFLTPEEAKKALGVQNE